VNLNKITDNKIMGVSVNAGTKLDV
jgi:hypothetical protein